jgi:hypothetical protein
MNDRLERNRNQSIEIRIAGHLSDQRSKSFEGLQITHLPDGETLISGEIKDQSQLFGILIRFRDLGIPLLSFKFLEPTNSKTKGASK